MSNGISMERVDGIIDGYGCEMHHLIAIMQDIQAAGPRPVSLLA